MGERSGPGARDGALLWQRCVVSLWSHISRAALFRVVFPISCCTPRARAPRAALRAGRAVRCAGSALAPSSFWLLKSEPSDYSIQQLAKDATTVWDGVRNAVARKNLRAMGEGDRCLFYHSSCKLVGVVGEATVIRTAYPDPAE